MTTQLQQRPTLSTDLYGTPHGWRTWPDWANLILGICLVLAPLWTLDAPIGWFIPLGLLIGVTALWAIGVDPSKTPERAMIGLSAVLILSPWLGGFSTAEDAAWTAWIIAVMVFAFALTALIHRTIFVDHEAPREHALAA